MVNKCTYIFLEDKMQIWVKNQSFGDTLSPSFGATWGMTTSHSYISVLTVALWLFLLTFSFICNIWQRCGYSSSFQLAGVSCHFPLVAGCKKSTVSLEHQYKLGKATFKTPVYISCVKQCLQVSELSVLIQPRYGWLQEITLLEKWATTA